MNKNRILWILVFLPLTIQAQTDGFQKSYNSFKDKTRSEYSNFRDEANQKYADFVRQAWKEYKTLPAIPKPKDEDKPPVVIRDRERKKPIESKPIPIKETITPTVPEPQPVPVAPIHEQPQPAEQWQTFSVYGTEMKVRVNDDLGDWAYLNMLSTLAENYLGKSNEATLLMAYVYCQSGYQMRLATANGRLYMLYASEHLIYDKNYFQLDGVKYYPYQCDEKRMHICTVSFPQEKPLSLMISHQQDWGIVKSNGRKLTSKQYPSVAATVYVNKNLVDFYNSYPTSCIGGNFMTRWAMYANTPIDETVSSSLYPALRSKIKGLSEKEAMERLLNWVQTAFVYEYDDKVWGNDRAFFAELYYPYCDCEDRSILLSRLVRDLLGLRCVLIYYPGHLAMAVNFREEVKGDYILLNGQHYVVCDPTYIGAPVGVTMSGMDNSRATVILLE